MTPDIIFGKLSFIPKEPQRALTPWGLVYYINTTTTNFVRSPTLNLNKFLY
ncbi:MAG: hypothetical protein V7L31_24385 [Nostoc sp.]|uniref:hypothetical protein n=1 Tax=Nostoc sp. TaxID=1180 RepID=UPI002FF19E80